jgi:hypothetical protein
LSIGGVIGQASQRQGDLHLGLGESGQGAEQGGLESAPVDPQGLAVGPGQLQGLGWLADDVLQPQLGGLDVAALGQADQPVADPDDGVGVGGVEQGLPQLVHLAVVGVAPGGLVPGCEPAGGGASVNAGSDGVHGRVSGGRGRQGAGLPGFAGHF